MRKPKSIHVSGRRWFEKVNGNTYHSCTVWADGEFVGRVPFTYGYGSQWEQTALDILKAAVGRKRWLAGAKYPLSLFLRESGIKYRSEVVDVSRKKDL